MTGGQLQKDEEADLTHRAIRLLVVFASKTGPA
jgi:hypothetical protein